jgi:hypothetical protein
MRNITDLQIANKYINLMHSANSRNKEFNLTLTSIKNLLKSSKCYYTGVTLDWHNFSVDRIDNSKGYIVGNVCACDSKINKLKSDLDNKSIIKLANKLKRI